MATVSPDFYVYVHRRATDGRIFYVGKGRNGRAWSNKGRNLLWQRTANKSGFVVEVVQTGMQEWWAFEMERELIASYGRDNLCNFTDGGEGAAGVVPSSETRAKLSAAGLGRKHTAEAKLKMSLALLGKKRTSEMNARNSAVRLGKPLKEATKAKLSAALMGHEVRDDVRKKIGDGNRGMKRDQKEIDRIRAMNTGRKHTAQSRANMGASRLGKKRVTVKVSEGVLL